jgi:hypothetical protein
LTGTSSAVLTVSSSINDELESSGKLTHPAKAVSSPIGAPAPATVMPATP